MLHCFLYDLLRVLIEILIVRGRADAQLRAEVLALRHQLGVLERQVGWPRWQPADRILLATISQACRQRTTFHTAFEDADLVAQHQQLSLIGGAVAEGCEG